MNDAGTKLAEIRERHERDDQWCKSLSIAGPQSHEDCAFLLAEITRLRANGCARNQGLTLHCGEAVLARDEIARLRARVEELERVRGVAQSLIDTASCLGWIAAATLRDDLRDALKEAKP